MNQPNPYALLLVACGSFIMLYNIFQSFRLMRQLSFLEQRRHRCPRILLTLYIGLLIFFFFGYAATGAMMASSLLVLSPLLVGLIFFLGSVFVMMGIFLQFSLSKAVKRGSLSVTQALISAVEARDKNLNGHSLHVARLSLLLYDRLPKAQRQSLKRSTLEYAALLHDIGKLGVSEATLNKDGPLDDAQWAEIKNHPSIGRDILRSIEGFEDVADWVLYHHERCDGKGYLGLPGEKIPLASRIISVADTFSALTMTRSYRPSRSYKEAAAVLRGCAGTQLDSGLVRLFLEIPPDLVQV